MGVCSALCGGKELALKNFQGRKQLIYRAELNSAKIISKIFRNLVDNGNNSFKMGTTAAEFISLLLKRKTNIRKDNRHNKISVCSIDFSRPIQFLIGERQMNEKLIDLTDLRCWENSPRAMELCKSIQGITDSQIKILSFGSKALEIEMRVLRDNLSLEFLYTFAKTVVRVYDLGGFYSSAHYEDYFNSEGRPIAEFRAALFKIEAIEELTLMSTSPDRAPWYHAWDLAINQIWPHRPVRNDEQLYRGEFYEESNYDC